jgi:hypothetical protein
MDSNIAKDLHMLGSKDANLRYESFTHLIKLSNQPVDWAYDAWDILLALMKNGDNHQRTIGAQLLSNLTKSDPDQRMLNDLDTLIEITKDEKFVTARHTLQCLWKIGIVNPSLRAKLIAALKKRFVECSTEKNCTLIRYDIVVVFRKMYDATHDGTLMETALALIETETDAKYKKKYLGEWKNL